MRRRFKNLRAVEDRGPLRVMFIHTELLVGGSETLLAEIIRGFDRNRFLPELCCLKRLGELGEILKSEVTTHTNLLRSKFDVGVLIRLTRLLRDRRIDAVVTVGTGGDRMFWGRLAACRAKVPVILSALHSSGYPQVVEPMNQILKPITDGFIGCAKMHSKYLIDGEKCPPHKVFTIPNGINLNRFKPGDKFAARYALGIPQDAPVCGIVAALREEKQHTLLLRAMIEVVQQFPNSLLLIIGDGPERNTIETEISKLDLNGNVRMLGTRQDVPEILRSLDVKVLSSKMEANPASTLEAAACGIATVAPRVGSIPETVLDGKTGILFPANDQKELSNAICRLLGNPDLARSMGRAGRDFVSSHYSNRVMIGGYEFLIEGVYRAACRQTQFLPSDLESLLSHDCCDDIGDTRVIDCV